MKRAFVAALICFISAGLMAHEHTGIQLPLTWARAR